MPVPAAPAVALPRRWQTVCAPAAVAALTVAALVLRASQLHQSLFGDEVLAYREIAGHSLGQVVHAVGTGVESSPPLFFVLAWLSSKLGDPTVWIRLPSLLLGAATVPVVWALGRETVGRDGALIGAAVTAVSPFATYYGVEARPYATMAFLVALSSLGLVRAARTNGWRDWLLYACAAAGAAYTHYTAVFALVAQFGWSLWVCRGPALRRLVPANLAAALAYLPWLPSLHGSALDVYAFLEPLTVGHVLADVLHPVAGYPYAPLTAIPTVAGLVAIGVCALAGAAAAAVARRVPVRAPVVLIGVLALATPVGLLIYSLVGTDLWSQRSLMGSAPAQALVLGTLVAALPRPAAWAAAVVVVGVLAFGTARALSPRWARPPYRAAAAYLDRAAGARDPVVMYSWRLVLDQAVVAQFRRRHVVVEGIPARWPRPAGGRMFVVVDDDVMRALHVTAPSAPGWARARTLAYHGLVDFDVITYRSGS